MTRKARAPVRTDLQEASRTSHMQITKVIAMNSPNNRSIPELFSDAVGQLAKLVGNEFELARAELSEKASQVGRAAAMIGAGAALVSAALIAAGLSRLSGDALKPSVALDQVQRDKTAAKEMVR